MELDVTNALFAKQPALPRLSGKPHLDRGAADPLGSEKLQAARKTAQDFEAVFLAQMLKPMFDGLNAEEPFGGGPGEEMWRSLQVEEYGKAIARQGGIGVAAAVMREILKTQEM